MFRTFAVLVSIAFLSLPAWTQESEDEPTDSAAVAEAEEQAEEETPEFDETGLDEQGFSNEDDDFDPSEDIPADQSIDFPADI